MAGPNAGRRGARWRALVKQAECKDGRVDEPTVVTCPDAWHTDDGGDGEEFVVAIVDDMVMYGYRCPTCGQQTVTVQ